MTNIIFCHNLLFNFNENIYSNHLRPKPTNQRMSLPLQRSRLQQHQRAVQQVVRHDAQSGGAVRTLLITTRINKPPQRQPQQLNPIYRIACIRSERASARMCTAFHWPAKLKCTLIQPPALPAISTHLFRIHVLWDSACVCRATTISRPDPQQHH